MIRPALALAAVVAVAALPALTHELKAGQLTLSKLHVRTPLGAAKGTAAYVVVTNPTAQADRLLSVSCACAKSATLHDMTVEGGIMKMRAAPNGFDIPPKSVLTLKPGGKHVMLTGLTKPLKDGERVALILTFAKAGRIEADFHVMANPGGADPKPAAAGHEHH